LDTTSRYRAAVSASRGVEASRSLVNQRRARVFGFLAAGHPRVCFHARVGPRRRSFPRCKTLRVHPSVTFLLFRVPSISFPLSPLPVRALPTEVLSLFAASWKCVHSSRGVPRPRYVTPTGFLSLPTFCSAPRLFGLISSQNHVQGFSPSRGFSPRAAPLSSSESVAPVPLVSDCSPSEDGHHCRNPRLRGLAPREAAFLGVAV